MYSRILLFLSLIIDFNSVIAEIKDFQIGVAVCLSGGCSEWGTSALRGVQLASEEINKNGGLKGKKISLVVEDTNEATSGANAIKAFQRIFSNPKVKYVIGPSWTPAGMALIPILKNHLDKIIITPSMAVPDFPRAADNLFKTVPDNSVTAEQIAEYAIKKGWKRCGILSDVLEAERYTSERFSTKFKEAGGSISALIETLPEETDLLTPILKLIQSKPEVIFLVNYVQLGNSAKKLRELGYTGPFISILLDKTRLVEGGKALEGTVFSKYASYSAEFESKFKNRFGESSGPSADSAYDTLYLLKKAFEESDTTDVEKIKHTLPKLQIKGTATLIKFNEFRTVDKPPLLFEVRSGEAVQIDF